MKISLKLRILRSTEESVIINELLLQKINKNNYMENFRITCIERNSVTVYEGNKFIKSKEFNNTKRIKNNNVYHSDSTNLYCNNEPIYTIQDAENIIDVYDKNLFLTHNRHEYKLVINMKPESIYIPLASKVFFDNFMNIIILNYNYISKKTKSSDYKDEIYLSDKIIINSSRLINNEIIISIKHNGNNFVWNLMTNEKYISPYTSVLYKIQNMYIDEQYVYDENFYIIDTINSKNIFFIEPIVKIDIIPEIKEKIESFVYNFL